MRRYKLWRAGDKYRVAISSIIRKEFVWLYLTRGEKRVDLFEKWRRGDCTDEFSVNWATNFLPPTCCTKHKKHNRRELGLFEEQFRCTEMKCLCSKTFCCYDSQSNKCKFKGLNKRTLEDSGDGHLSKNRKVLESVTLATTSNRGFRTLQRAVAIFEQTKKGFSNFYPERNVQQEGIHTLLLIIQL